MDAFSASSLSEFFYEGSSWSLSSFLVDLAIFSSYNLMHGSFSSFSLTRFFSVTFMAAISSSKLFVLIVITGMTMVLEESTSISNWKTCPSDGEEESLL